MRNTSTAIIKAVALAIVCGASFCLHAQTAPPAIQRGPMWSRLRTALPSIMSGGGYKTEFAAWNVAVSLASFRDATFFDALDKQQPLLVNTVEGISTQKVSAAIPKNLDENLTAEEVNAVREKLSAAKVRLIALDVPDIGSDESRLRRLFQFAKSLNIAVIVAAPPPASLPAIDRLANEFEINVAILDDAVPQTYMHNFSGLGKRVGFCMDIGSWLWQAAQRAGGLEIPGDRLMAVHLLDRGSDSRGISQILHLLSKVGANPVFLSAAYIGAGDVVADLSKSLDALDKMMQPIAIERVDQISKVTPIRGSDRLSESDREAVQAAVPASAQVTPKKPRKLLVVDLNVAYPGHGSIPAANLAIRLWAEKTGAYTPIFDNNLDNLKYPKIKEFDAVFLNNTVGQLFVDPAVREGLMRFVREGGGLGAYHGTPHASIDWPEFGDMLAARAGSHRDPKEKATIRIEDPNSPLTAAFDGKEFEWQDEFFRFTRPPFSRQKVHVLLSFDTDKTDLHQKPDCDICNPADNDYPVSWIRSYGQGRIFYATIGHLPTIFERPTMARFMLAGIQFILGDLHADTTPGPN